MEAPGKYAHQAPVAGNVSISKGSTVTAPDAQQVNANGNPLEIDVGRMIRFLRLELPRDGMLHLDQVQVLSPVR